MIRSPGRGDYVDVDFARQLERELAEATAENTRLRAALASSKDPCVYCQLPKDEMVKCRSGFPGCARADDLMGCPELGAALEAERLEGELAREKRHTEAVMRTLKDALGIEDGRECLEEVGRLKDGAARYEYLRKLNPREFTMLTLFCVTADVHFDTEVDRRRSTT